MPQPHARLPLRARLDLLGVLAGLVAAAVLVARAPDPVGAEGAASAAPFGLAPSAGGARSTATEDALAVTRVADVVGPLHGVPLWSAGAVEVPLPHVAPDGRPAVDITGAELLDAGDALTLRVPAAALSWGVNPAHVTGRDVFGHPVDRVVPVLVADEDADEWARDVVVARLTREGFDDDDAVADDLASLIEAAIPTALAALGRVEAGPVGIRDVRPGSIVATLTPTAGALRGEVTLRDVSLYLDAELGPVRAEGPIRVHLVRLAVSLSARADADGRPVVEVTEVTPDLDLVGEGEGALHWIVDHAAWVVEAIGEAMAQEPIEEALAGGLDAALRQWVDRLVFETVPPLRVMALEAGWRFGFVRLTDEGLVVGIDLRLGCGDGEPVRAAPRLVRRPRPPLASALGPPGDGAVDLLVAAEGVNAALHGLWACGALDAEVDLREPASSAPWALPERLVTRFAAPPLLQRGEQGEAGAILEIGVAALDLEARWPDADYDVRLAGLLPIRLERALEGRGLAVAFDRRGDTLALFTDCRAVSGRPCADNPLFDRIAWFAVPLMPPIGATLPLPDLRLPDQAEGPALTLRLDDLRWDPDGAVLSTAVRWELVP